GQRQVGTRDSVDAAILAVLAFTCTKQDYASECRRSTGHVYDTGASKVAEAKVTQGVHAEHRVAAPGPAAFHRVDETGHDHCEGKERPQFHALGDRTGHDRHRGSNKHDLEEEVRGTGVDRATTETVFAGREVTQYGIRIHVRNTGQEYLAAVHDGVTAHQVHDAGSGIQCDVLGQNFGGVLGTHQTGFEHGKASCHPHDECTTDKEVERIHGVLKFINVVFHGETLRRKKNVLAGKRGYTASSPVSPVRIRIACSRVVTKILPSPILPVLAALAMDSIT